MWIVINCISKKPLSALNAMQIALLEIPLKCVILLGPLVSFEGQVGRACLSLTERRMVHKFFSDLRVSYLEQKSTTVRILTIFRNKFVASSFTQSSPFRGRTQPFSFSVDYCFSSLQETIPFSQETNQRTIQVIKRDLTHIRTEIFISKGRVFIK